jgi:hypothetical protein
MRQAVVKLDMEEVGEKIKRQEEVYVIDEDNVRQSVLVVVGETR